MIDRNDFQKKMRGHRPPRKHSFSTMRVIVLLLASLLFASCSAVSTSESQVPSRSQARWDALLEGDYETAYEYLSPGYRSSVSRVDYEVEWRIRRVNYESAQYKSHDCDEYACTVKIFVAFNVSQPIPGVPVFKSTRMLEETWVQADGAWWFVPKK